MIGIEIVRDQQTKEKAAELRNCIVDLAFHKGLCILGAGENTPVVPAASSSTRNRPNSPYARWANASPRSNARCSAERANRLAKAAITISTGSSHRRACAIFLCAAFWLGSQVVRSRD